MPPIVILIANKADLTYTPGERVVSTAEGRQRAEEIEAHAFHEISVRESVEQVTLIPKFLFSCHENDYSYTEHPSSWPLPSIIRCAVIIDPLPMLRRCALT